MTQKSKHILAILAISGIFLIQSCVSFEKKTARRALIEAETAINSAKLLEPETAESSEIKAALDYYKEAAKDFQRGISDAGKEKSDPADIALLAKKAAESAIMNAKALNEQLKAKNEKLEEKIESLKFTLQSLRKNKAAGKPALPPDTIYKNARSLFMNGDYEGSRQIFQSFLEVYPKHALSDNSQYWIGECYYSQKMFNKASEAFDNVLKNYNGWNKTPDALLKRGLCLENTGKRQEAEAYYKRAIERYPKSPSAKIARKCLKK